MSNEQIKLQILGSITETLGLVSEILADIQFGDEAETADAAPTEQPYHPHGPDAIRNLPADLLSFLNHIRSEDEVTLAGSGDELTHMERLMGLDKIAAPKQEYSNEKEAFEAGILDGVEAALQKLLGPSAKITRFFP